MARPLKGDTVFVASVASVMPYKSSLPQGIRCGRRLGGRLGKTFHMTQVRTLSMVAKFYQAELGNLGNEPSDPGSNPFKDPRLSRVNR